MPAHAPLESPNEVLYPECLKSLRVTLMNGVAYHTASCHARCPSSSVKITDDLTPG